MNKKSKINANYKRIFHHQYLLKYLLDIIHLNKFMIMFLDMLGN
jgi:hypothetical protein